MKIQSINPATEEVNKEFETITKEQVKVVAKDSRSAFREWSNRTKYLLFHCRHVWFYVNKHGWLVKESFAVDLSPFTSTSDLCTHRDRFVHLPFYALQLLRIGHRANHCALIEWVTELLVLHLLYQPSDEFFGLALYYYEPL